MNVEPGIQIDLAGALRRRASLVASIAGAVFLVAYWIAMSLPNEYTSYATMLVEPPSINEDLVESGVAERDLNTRLNLMTSLILSRSRLSKLIDDFGLYEDESKTMTRAEVIGIMRGAIRIIPVAGALVADSETATGGTVNTFQIYFTYEGYAAPAKIAQRLAQDFIDEHIDERVKVTQKSFEFIEVEQNRLIQRIQKIEASIAEVKSLNMGSLPENIGSNQQHLIFTITDLRRAEQTLAEAESDQQFWGSQDRSLAPERNVADNLSPGRRLQALELRLTELSARGYTDKHPDVVASKLEMSEIRGRVARAELDGDNGETMNFAQLAVAAERKRAELRIATTRGEIGRLQQAIADVQSRTASIPRVAEQLDGLRRQWEQLSRNLADFENRRLKAFVQANLERRQLGEQFRILEAAFAPDGPSSPNRPLILAIGAILGLMMGMGLGFMVEMMDTSVHAPLELQMALSIPVLASVPSILFESDRLARFRRRMRFSLAAATVVVFGLAGGLVSYVAVNGAPTILKDLMGGGEQQEQEPADEGSAVESAWRLPQSSIFPWPEADLPRSARG